MELNKTIKEAIEKQLPGEVGSILKERLKQAEDDQVALKKKTEDYDYLLKQYVEVEKAWKDAVKVKAEAEAIVQEKKSLDYAKKVFDIEKTILDNKVIASQEKVDLMNNLVGLLMKNPQAVTFMNTTHDYEFGTRKDGTWGKVGVPNSSYSETETKIDKP